MAYQPHTETDEETGITLIIEADEDLENPYDPRDDDGQLITIFSSRYINPAEKACPIIGDRSYDLSDVDDAKVFEEASKAVDSPYYVIPLYCYDHSGTVYKVGESNPFSCPWDSGRAGFIALKRSEWGGGNESDEKLQEYAQNVAGAYTDYANGNGYGYIVEDAKGEELDASGGYLGDYDSSGGALEDGKAAFASAVADRKAELAKDREAALVAENAALETSRPDLYQDHALRL